MTWKLFNEVYNPDEDVLKEYVGFVYLITELDTNKKYVGKKFFWSTRKLPPLKGAKRKRTVVKQSDWQDYYGSSEHLKEAVEQKGVEAYHREILHLCKTKGECSYLEAKEQFDRDEMTTTTHSLVVRSTPNISPHLLNLSGNDLLFLNVTLTL